LSGSGARGPLGAKQLDSLWVPAEQRPRSLWVPERASSAGDEVMEVVRMGRVGLDPWQEFALRESVGERADGLWAAKQVGIEVPRQNGKGEIMLGRQLAGLFLFEETEQVHSAHEFKTSLAAFQKLKQVVEDTPAFDNEVLSIKGSHGEEGIYLRRGRCIRFFTRTQSGGRGLSGRDLLYLDEAMILPSAMMASLMPILSAQPNPQMWLVGSSVDQENHEHGLVFAKLRARGLRQNDPRAMWMGYGWCPTNAAEQKAPLLPDHRDAAPLVDDPKFLSRSNPALGIRITDDFVEEERETLPAREFAVERAGIGDWPDTSQEQNDFFDMAAWKRSGKRAAINSVPVIGIDVSTDRARSSIAASGKSAGDARVEVIERRRGTSWIVGRVADIVEKQGVKQIVINPKSQAATLIPAIEEKVGFEVTVVSADEYSEACGTFLDAANAGTLLHGAQPELDEALKGVATRSLGERFAWDKKKSENDITPLCAVTLARWGALKGEEVSVYEKRGLVIV
jgi:phage terminase large subunit-like protein